MSSFYTDYCYSKQKNTLLFVGKKWVNLLIMNRHQALQQKNIMNCSQPRTDLIDNKYKKAKKNCYCKKKTLDIEAA